MKSKTEFLLNMENNVFQAQEVDSKYSCFEQSNQIRSMVNLYKGKQTPDMCFSFTFYLLVLTQLLPERANLLIIGR